MKNSLYTPEANEKLRELQIITRSMMLLALLTGILYARVFITTTLSELETNNQQVIGSLSFLFLTTAIIGLLLTWRWAGIGGATVLGSGIGLTILSYFTRTESPWLSAFFYGSPFVITGSLCLFYWWRAKRI